jgi:hypothetical protein
LQNNWSMQDVPNSPGGKLMQWMTSKEMSSGFGRSSKLEDGIWVASVNRCWVIFMPGVKVLSHEGLLFCYLIVG